MYDCRLDPTTEKKKNPLWKIQSLLDELNHQAKKMWLTGRWVSIDEQTLGFKGKHGLKLRITYKKEGDGFQCDAVCDRGYTFSFYFRHGDAPKLPRQFDHLNLSPTAKRVVWLVLRLPNNWTNVFMDNLFNSRKLFTALYIAKALGHGVARTDGRGLPPSVIQKVEKNAKAALALSGTTKAAVLNNCEDCPNLLAVSVYDTKPVHILSMVSGSVKWIQKKRKIWDARHKEARLIGFLRLNVIDDYNNNMNSTDIADQYRNVYRPDHWMRNRKWWWAFFIWAIGVAAVNAYILYDEMYEEEKGNGGLPPKWSHMDFMVELVYDMIFPEQTKAHVEMMKDMASSQSFASAISSARSLSSFNSFLGEDNNVGGWDFTCESGILGYLKEVKQSSMNKARVEGNFFVRRFDGLRHGTVSCGNKLPDMHCQYCYYQWSNNFNDEQKESNITMKRNRKEIRRCLVCNVNLCPMCENEFHGIMMSDNAALLGKK